MNLSDETLTLSPSDLTGFLACEHLTALALKTAAGELTTPAADNPQGDLIRRKGEEHEAAYLENLRAQGLTVHEVEFDFRDWAAGEARTLDAMRAGIQVVYQGVFAADGWRGLADFLIRVDTPSNLGAWSYEALDTKLARSAKPAYILQLLFYNEQLARLQGREPEQIHVLLGSGERQSFRPQEFAAYYRRVRSRLEQFVAAPPATEPFPCDHCDICDFKTVCESDWVAVDHLSLVAGMTRNQIGKLETDGITTLAALGGSPVEPTPIGIAVDTWRKLREQAELQLQARLTGKNVVRLIQPEPGTGFALLPEPSPGDLFFDFEGNPFWDKDGSLEYLWGILDTSEGFKPLHAHDRPSERQAFEEFIDLVHGRLIAFPEMHVYHYAQYEITALRRLMGYYGTREAELDDLLRQHVFVDLYRVVRNGIRTSRPGYGLKELEAFLPIERQAEVKDGGTSIVVFEQWMQTGDGALLDQIDAYNKEDCIATLQLRDWLLTKKAEALAQFGPFPEPLPEPEPRPIPEVKLARAGLRQQLLDTGHQLAAELLDYHDRERKPVWWAFYARLEMTSEELVDDPEAIGGLKPVGGPAQVTKQSKAYTFAFPAQEHKLRQGQDTFDPKTGKSPGKLIELDRDQQQLVLQRGPTVDKRAMPEALIPGRPYDTDDQEDAIVRLGRSLLAGDHTYRALESILDRKPFDRAIQTRDLDAMKQLVLDLDGRHLVIQGPPGSGKTWTSGRLIAHLMRHGKTVAVASTSHKAIHNLLDAIEDAAAESGLHFTGLKKRSGDAEHESHYEHDHISSVDTNGDCVDCDLAAGTAWLVSDPDHDRRFDYLFIDEAGQVSLADALAMGTCARNVVLVGDPQQLDQVIQGTHPAGSGDSVLKHLIGDDATIAPDRGLFLEQTYRLHPDVCRYISEEFYDGRLTHAEQTTTRTTPYGTGLRFLPVEHDGNRQESAEEVEIVVTQVERLHAAGVKNIKIVAAFNAQVNALKARLPATIEVGTVDKFQGQEADVIIYSMASSSGEDVPRGLEFLLSRNRLNVAISRARCLSYLVASPRLLEVNCRTIPQMRLANALCRFVELAN